jgi:plasmid stabilization system protein ParE
MLRRNVVLQTEAERNVSGIRDWIADRSADGARRWFDQFLRTVDLIRDDPERFAIAPESHVLSREVRQASFRMSSGRVYRILFTLADDEIHVLYVRAPGQGSIDQ